VDPKKPPALPVAALPYHHDADVGWSLEVRLIIVAAMVTALNGLSTFATVTWNHLQAVRFRTVGGYRSVWSLEFAPVVVGVVIELVLIVGGAAFFARRRVCRPLLIGGAAAMLTYLVVTSVYYTIGTRRTGADLVVMSVRRVAVTLGGAVVPVLTLAVMTRPYVTARFRRRTGE
jgi:hypothetical protein